MRRMCVLVGIGLVTTLVWGAPASAATGDVTCTGTAPASVPYPDSLIVPPGQSCTIEQGSTVGWDVVVQQGATLISYGGRIGHDVRASSPKGIVFFGAGTAPDGKSIHGRVGNDLRVDGITDFGYGSTNYVCSTDIVHDLVLTNSAASAGEWVVGDAPELCADGNTVGHDLVVQNNKNRLEISDNRMGDDPPPPYGIGHDLRVTGNATAPVVEGNTAAHDAVCQSNLTTDEDHEPDGIPDRPNIAAHINTCVKPG